MTVEEIEAIVGGYHGDAFRVLGPHAVRKRRGASRAGRCARFCRRPNRPRSSPAASACADGEEARRRAFSARRSNGEPAAYRIRARLWDGREVEIDDPYRFGPQISDSDLYLHTEGTLYEAYRTLGAHLAEVEGVRRRALRRLGAQRRERHASPASSTSGTSAATPCGGATAASGRSSCPGSARARPTSTTSARASPAISS